MQNESPNVRAADLSLRERRAARRRAERDEAYRAEGDKTGRTERPREQIDALEVYDLLRKVNDPEHPLTLEQLSVVQYDLITVDDAAGTVHLLRSLPRRFKIDVVVTPGTHASEHAVNKQLNDKERVAAALDNAHLLGVINTCLRGSDDPDEEDELADEAAGILTT